MGLIQNLWDRYGLRGVAFAILALFFLFRVYQLLFQHRQLKRERLRANYAVQMVLGFLLSAAALVLCEPPLVGLPPDVFGFGTAPVGSDVAPVQPVASAGPKVAWTGPLAGVKKDVDAQSWNAAAKALFELRRSGTREEDVRRVLHWDAYMPAFVREYGVLGQAAAKSGDKILAKQYAALAIELGGDHDSYLLHATLLDTEDWKYALDDLDQAIRKAKSGDYRALEARLAVRLAHLSEGETRDALRDIEVLLRAHPGDVKLTIQRGRLRLALGAMDGAIADLESASRATPDDVTLRLALAEARLQKGTPDDMKRAITDLDKAVSGIKESEAPRDAFKARLLRAQAKLGLNKANDALPDASKAVSLDPKSADAFYYRGRIELELDRGISAKKDLEEAIRLDPKHRRAVFWHGLAVYDRDPKQGLVDFSKAIEIEPDGWAHYYRGECLFKLGKWDNAESAYTEALTVAQDEKLLKLVREALARVQTVKKR